MMCSIKILIDKIVFYSSSTPSASMWFCGLVSFVPLRSVGNIWGPRTYHLFSKHDLISDIVSLVMPFLPVPLSLCFFFNRALYSTETSCSAHFIFPPHRSRFQHFKFYFSLFAVSVSHLVTITELCPMLRTFTAAPLFSCILQKQFFSLTKHPTYETLCRLMKNPLHSFGKEFFRLLSRMAAIWHPSPNPPVPQADETFCS